MTTTIQYKTLVLTKSSTRNKTTFSKAKTVYKPNLFDEHVINLVKPAAGLVEIEQTIFEEKILRTLKNTDPLFSFVWFLN